MSQCICSTTIIKIHYIDNKLTHHTYFENIENLEEKYLKKNFTFQI
jgi:hypothetical protein